MPRYTVAREFRLKRDAQKWAEKQREAGYGVQVSLVTGDYIVWRTDRPLKSRK